MQNSSKTHKTKLSISVNPPSQKKNTTKVPKYSCTNQTPLVLKTPAAFWKSPMKHYCPFLFVYFSIFTHLSCWVWTFSVFVETNVHTTERIGGTQNIPFVIKGCFCFRSSKHKRKTPFFSTISNDALPLWILHHCVCVLYGGHFSQPPPRRLLAKLCQTGTHCPARFLLLKYLTLL